MLELNDVTLKIGRRTLLDRVSMTAEPGVITGLMGPNGCGKSLVLRVLATDLRPTSGSGQVGGLDIMLDRFKVRQIVGYLPEPTAPPTRTSVAEYLNVAASGHRLKGRDRRAAVDEALELTDMSQLAKADLSTLSRGEFQRAELARTLVHDPQVLLLDEPLAGLDLVGSAETLEILRELARLGKTLLLATNVPEWYNELIATAVLVYEGRTLAAGDAGSLCAPFPDIETPTYRAAVLRHVSALGDNGREPRSSPEDEIDGGDR